MRRRFTPLLYWLFLTLSIPSLAQNSALNFTGSNYVEGPTNNMISDLSDLTVEFWAYVPAPDGNIHQFVSEGDPTSFAFNIGYDGTGQLLAGDGWWETVNFTPIPTGVTLPSAQWIHIALVHTSTFPGTTIIYVNGAAVASNPNWFFIANASGTNLRLGAQADATPSQKFTGKIDEFRVWNVARTPAQLKANMFGNISGTGPNADPDFSNLAVYYPINGSSGTTVTNNSPSAGFDGTINNDPGGTNSWAYSPIAGNSNALVFDGTDDQVTIPNTTGLYDLPTGTIEFWVNPTSFSGNSTIFANQGTGGSRYSFEISSTQIGIRTGAGAGTFSGINYSLPTGAWSHLAFVTDGSQTTVYVNGVAQSPVLSVTYGTATTQPVTMGVGTDNTGSPTQFFAGGIDEVRIWNTQRTALDITNFKDFTMSGQESGLVGLFSFNQGTSDGDNRDMPTVIDNSPNTNNGTMSGFALNNTGSNFTQFTLSPAPLPVTLVAFTANRQGNQALLQWQTSLEQNSSEFIIERSADGITFAPIGTVAAAGTSNSIRKYSFIDAKPGANNNFYRLKQVDFDGQSAYSSIRLLVFPVTGRLVWYTTGNRSAEVWYQQGNVENYLLSDMNGNILRQGRLSGGRTTVSNLPAGSYIVRITTATGQILTTKVLLP